MKVIVVSGASSNVGKTYLSRELCRLLPGAVRIKIGHHAPKPDGDDNLYQRGTTFSEITTGHPHARFLVIESNHILEELADPHCVIYLPADNPKPSAKLAAERADITRGRLVPASKLSAIAGRLECDEGVVRRIAELSGALLPEEESR